ncbi:MAG TPA: hypothetical protein VNX68_19235 [Nitrosopumilaceae archaeon]|jgi:hypothetical protein|nr:hypothetical protein [Nitrosopumilaceae archaeon]
MNLSQFESLVTDNIKAEDKERILAGVVNVKTPFDILGENFACKYLDHYGRVAAITFRGMEVVLLFKRATTKNSTLDLSVPPLKNSNDAWMVVRLMDVYSGLSMADRVENLEKKLAEKDKLLTLMEQQLTEADVLLVELMGKRNKKLPAPAQSIKVPMASVVVNEYLRDIKPVKLNVLVREYFLWAQGFNADLSSPVNSAPEIPPKLKVRLFKKLKRIEKWMKDAKRKSEIVPYDVQPAKEVKKTKTKKSAKAKTVKKSVQKKVKKKK